MLPENILSSTAVTGDFILAKGLDISSVLDYEDGGIALDDPSEGNQYQVWRGRLVGDDIILDAPEVEPTIIYSASNITEISFTFDHNMRPAVTYVQAGVVKLRWYDTSIPAYNILGFSGAITPKIVMDDKRETQTSNKDMLLVYLQEGKLCYRQQRDRFLIEYVLAEGPYERLLKIGMNTRLRMQFILY